MNTTARRTLLAATSLVGIMVGAWAAGLPRAFYDSFPGVGLGPWVAVDGPYNEHLVRDVGALYLALAAAGVFAAFSRGASAGRAVGIAWVVFSVPHLAYHVGHLEGFDPVNALVEIVSLSSTIALAIPLLLPKRAPTVGGAGHPEGMKITRQITVFDAPDLETESAFWAGLLGGTLEKEDDWHSLYVDGQPRLGFQLAPDHIAPDWPDGQPQQIHLDLYVDDIRSAHDEALALGARLLKQGDHESAEGFTVYADPAGHPFCLCWG